jgi:hypothetical protein
MDHEAEDSFERLRTESVNHAEHIAGCHDLRELTSVKRTNNCS